MMKNKFILPILFLGLVLAIPVQAAPGDVTIVFEQSPLFSNSNFLPGDSVTRYIQVTNNGTEAHDIFIKSVNVDDSDGLGDQLHLVIKEGATELYSDTLAQFFTDDIVFLSNLGASSNTQYDLSVTFEPEAGNEYQGDTVIFDFIIGFDDSVVDGGPLGTNGGGGEGCGDGCGIVFPSPSVTPTPTPGGVGGGSPDPTPTPTPIVGGASTTNPNTGNGLTVGSDFSEDEASDSNDVEGTYTEASVLFASIFGFLPCHWWLVIVLFILVALTLLDREYEFKRKIWMLLILAVFILLAILGYISCSWWIYLIILLAIAYLLFRRYGDSDSE